MKKQISVIALSVLIGCTLTPDYQRPKTELPLAWANSPEQLKSTEVTAKWWKNYGSDELNELIEQALLKNNDLIAGLHRVEQARATTKIAGAPLLPSVDGSSSAGKTYNNRSRTNGSKINQSYNAQVNISYELDLFSRNRSASEAAKTRANASKYDYDALALITAADVADAYAQYLSLNDRVGIAEKNLGNGRDILKIVRARHDAGKVSALELSQQNAALATLETSITNLKNQREAAQSQLAILTGATPETLKLTGQSINEISPPAIKPIQPGELLEKRPDIMSAEAKLIAANMDIGTAKADFFPKLQIGATPEATASSLSNPVNLAAAFLASVTQPIFKGGALEGNLELSEARKKELAAQYSGLVLTALKEVEDSLSLVTAANDSFTSSTKAQTENQKAYNIAKLRYDAGKTDFQTLLDTKNALFQAEDNFSQARLNQVSASISLYKSLGGGWIKENDL